MWRLSRHCVIPSFCNRMWKCTVGTAHDHTDQAANMFTVGCRNRVSGALLFSVRTGCCSRLIWVSNHMNLACEPPQEHHLLQL